MDKNNYPGKYQNQSFCSVAPWVPRVFPFFPSERMSFIKLCRFLTPEADRLGKNSVSVAVFSSNQDFSSWILITNCPPFLKEGKSFWVQRTRSVLLFFSSEIWNQDYFVMNLDDFFFVKKLKKQFIFQLLLCHSDVKVVFAWSNVSYYTNWTHQCIDLNGSQWDSDFLANIKLFFGLKVQFKRHIRSLIMDEIVTFFHTDILIGAQNSDTTVLVR